MRPVAAGGLAVVLLLAVVAGPAPGYERTRGHLAPGQAAADAARLVRVAERFLRTKLEGGCIRLQGAHGLKTLVDLVNEEGRGYSPPRSGNEVALYRRLKEAIGRGEPLEPETVFEMGLEACARDGEVALQDVFLTIHNVVRILARPETWWSDYTYTSGRVVWTPRGNFELTRGRWEPGWRGMQKDTVFPIIRDVTGDAPVYGIGPTLADIRGKVWDTRPPDQRARHEADLERRAAAKGRSLDATRTALAAQKVERSRLAQEMSDLRAARARGTLDLRVGAALQDRLQAAIEAQDAAIEEAEGAVARLQDELGSDITRRATDVKYTRDLFSTTDGPFSRLYGAEEEEGNGGCWYYFWLGAMVYATEGTGAEVLGRRYEDAQKWLGSETEYARGLVQLSHFRGGAELGRQAWERFRGCDPTPTPPPTPPATPGPTPAPDARAAARPVPHWKYVGPRAEKATRTSGTPLSVAAEAAEGGISITARYGPDEPSTYAVDCTWEWSAPGGLGELAPGQVLSARMTIVDRSVYFRTYDGYDHGYAGGAGVVRIDKPGLGPGVAWADARDVLNVSTGYQKTATQDGTLAVPAGPLWEGKMALKATCPGGLVERVYEWVPGGGR